MNEIQLRIDGVFCVDFFQCLDNFGPAALQIGLEQIRIGYRLQRGDGTPIFDPLIAMFAERSGTHDAPGSQRCGANDHDGFNRPDCKQG